jgi:hypothetical protein
LDVDILELFRVALKQRVRFQNDVVLIQLRIKRVDLPLPESVVKRIVDGGWRDAESRGRGAIDGNRRRQTTQLLIGYHVG